MSVLQWLYHVSNKSNHKCGRAQYTVDGIASDTDRADLAPSHVPLEYSALLSSCESIYLNHNTPMVTVPRRSSSKLATCEFDLRELSTAQFPF